MRLYLSGALMLLNTDISILHHHAPRGGLRTHRARQTTAATSRLNLLRRNLPEVTEVYLAMRYFGPRQVRYMLLIRCLSTLGSRGSAIFRLTKAVIGLVLMPHTVWHTWRKVAEAEVMLVNRQSIPSLFRQEESCAS